MLRQIGKRFGGLPEIKKPHVLDESSKATDLSVWDQNQPTLRTRTVLIYAPSRSVMQAGCGNSTNRWIIDFDRHCGPQHKWESPLMCWTSTADPTQGFNGANLSFPSRRAAVDYANSQCWSYTVVSREEDDPAITKPRSYGDNFVYQSGPKLKHITTK
jgi:hypothetical protein